MNYYQTLKLADFSSILEVKQAYDCYKKNYNPQNISKEYIEEFKRICEAVYFLSEENRKEKYDYFFKNEQLESREFLEWKFKEKEKNQVWKKSEENNSYDGLEGIFYIIGELLSSINH